MICSLMYFSFAQKPTQITTWDTPQYFRMNVDMKITWLVLQVIKLKIFCIIKQMWVFY